MTNSERLINVFVASLNIKQDTVTDELAYNTIPQWDSVAHMVLIAALEQEFDVMLDMDEIIDMNSVKVAKEILSKHKIEFI